MTRDLGHSTAKQIADNHETDPYTRDWLWWRGMDFANNYYGRQLAERQMSTASGPSAFRAAFFDAAERFVRSGLGCSIANYKSAAPHGPEAPRYTDSSRCGRG